MACPVAVGSAIVRALVVSASVLSVWLVGRYQFSIVWLLVGVVTYMVYVVGVQNRLKKTKVLRNVAVDEETAVKTELQDLPAWVQFPDLERVEWINKLLAQLWPYINKYAGVFIKNEIEPLMKAQMPAGFRSFQFETIDLGAIPPRLGGMKTYEDSVGREQVVMDVELTYAGDCNITVSVGAFGAGIQDIVIIEFDLTGLGEIVELPGLRSCLENVVTGQVRSLLLLPNEIVVPLVANLDDLRLTFPEPEGILHICVIEARNLENTDMSLLRGKSDPYAKLAVGSQFFKTDTIDNSLNPTWNAKFEAIVDQASGQNLSLDVFDEDAAGDDELLGSAVVELDTASERKRVDLWFPLEGVKHGDIHLDLQWMKLVPVLDPEAVKTDYHPALLMVYVDSVKNLPVRDSTTDSSLGQTTIPVNAVLEADQMELYQNSWSLPFGPHTSEIMLTLKLRVRLQPQRAPSSNIAHLLI